jgi:hypothetical protein
VIHRFAVLLGAFSIAACNQLFGIDAPASGADSDAHTPVDSTLDSPLDRSTTDAAEDASIQTGADARRPDEGASIDRADVAVTDSPTSCHGRHGPDMIPIAVAGGADFCIDATEVTNAQYLEFLYAPDVGPQPEACGANDSYNPRGDWLVKPSLDDYPVTGVDWCDAWAYCRWAGKRLCGRFGGGSISPNETASASASQWFYACSRAGTRSSPNGAMTMCNSHSRGTGALERPRAAPACEGGYSGIFDMVGNVAEWIDACGQTDAGDTCYIQGGSFADATQSCATLYPWPRISSDEDYGIRCCSL